MVLTGATKMPMQSCPTCGTPAQVGEADVGMVVDCTKCGHWFKIAGAPAPIERQLALPAVPAAVFQSEPLPVPQSLPWPTLAVGAVIFFAAGAISGGLGVLVATSGTSQPVPTKGPAPTAVAAPHSGKFELRFWNDPPSSGMDTSPDEAYFRIAQASLNASAPPIFTKGRPTVHGNSVTYVEWGSSVQRTATAQHIEIQEAK
jgi:hypothetical protein